MFGFGFPGSKAQMTPEQFEKEYPELAAKMKADHAAKLSQKYAMQSSNAQTQNPQANSFQQTPYNNNAAPQGYPPQQQFYGQPPAMGYPQQQQQPMGGMYAPPPFQGYNYSQPAMGYPPQQQQPQAPYYPPPTGYQSPYPPQAMPYPQQQTAPNQGYYPPPQGFPAQPFPQQQTTEVHHHHHHHHQPHGGVAQTPQAMSDKEFSAIRSSIANNVGEKRKAAIQEGIPKGLFTCKQAGDILGSIASTTAGEFSEFSLRSLAIHLLFDHNRIVDRGNASTLLRYFPTNRQNEIKPILGL